MWAVLRVLLVVSLASTCARAELHRVVRDGLYGFIDSAGRIVIQPRFVWAEDFQEGRAAVFVCGKEGYLDETGRVVIAPQFSRAYEFREGRALVGVPGKGWGFIDPSGRLATPLYEGALGFANGLAAVRFGSKWGYIDRDGNVRISARFDAAYYFVASHRAIAVLDGAGVLIDRSGRVTATARDKVDEALSDGTGVSPASADGVARVDFSDAEWGYVTREGSPLWRAPWDAKPDHRPLLGWSDEQVRKSCR